MNFANHFVRQSAKDVEGLNSEIYNNTNGIKLLNYTKMNDAGNYASLTSHKDWILNFWEKYLTSDIAIKRMKTGCNYWKQNTSAEITEMAEDARTNFNIDARIEFVYRDEVNKCYHLYSFYSDRKNADRAYSFYGLHTAKLIKFIAYFNKAAAHLITEANKPENLITIPDYTPPPLPEPHRKFVEEMQAVGASVELCDRETEVMILYAAGCTSKQIAEIFCRSISTIETHLEHIRKKTGCKDRKEMNVYVRELGLSGMERFFFSYFTH